MRLHYLQHADFETPDNILIWAKNNNISISKTLLYNNEILPEHSNYDFLVIMGGPMNVYEENLYPWLKDEKKFIEQAIKNNKKILGICLGAQLLATVLGAKVYKNQYKEIGWFDVNLTEKAKQLLIFKNFPDSFTTFHYHEDTFEIPINSIKIGESNACKNQGFVYNNVLALQFHPEISYKSMQIFMGEEKLIKDKFIQTNEEILNNKLYYELNNKLLNSILNKFFIT